MLHLDDVQLYDLSEAGALLFSDPARLTRLARLRRVPSALVEADLGLPSPWVEAESGRSGADPESLRGYWLERLAPPAPDVRRPRRDLARLPAESLLTADEAAARLYATAQALQRLTQDGTLPALRVEGAVRYDAALVDLVARADDGDEDGEAASAAAGARRAEVRSWARFEYDGSTPEPPAASPAGAPRFEFPAAVRGAKGGSNFGESGSPDPDPPAPGAWQIPDDLGVQGIAPLEETGPGEAGQPEEAKPPSTLIDVDGFDTIDED